MNEIEIVKHIMRKTRVSGQELAKSLGKKNEDGKGQASYVNNRLQSKTMTVEKLLELLDGLNCELVIRETRGDKESFVVDNENRNEVKSYKKKQDGEE